MKKIVLHSNILGDAAFNQYRKCNFFFERSSILTGKTEKEGLKEVAPNLQEKEHVLCVDSKVLALIISAYSFREPAVQKQEII